MLPTVCDLFSCMKMGGDKEKWLHRAAEQVSPTTIMRDAANANANANAVRLMLELHSATVMLISQPTQCLYVDSPEQVIR